MARFTEASKQRVREATDLVELAGEYTELRRAGADRITGSCPLHEERTPSFTISPSKQLFKCFGCDAGGDVLSLVQLKEGLDFPAAVEFLARRAGIPLEREDEDHRARARRTQRDRELVRLERAAVFYAEHLRAPKSSEAARAAEYLASRGIGDAIRERFRVGFAPVEELALLRAARASGFSTEELSAVGLVSRHRGRGGLQDRFRGRLMLPVCDARGRVLGFGARRLDSGRGPKYLNSPASAIYRKGELLYGAHQARVAAAKTGAVIVVEGYTDALAMHQAGISNAVALMGTAISEQQIAVLKRLAPTIVLMLDGDEAGSQATMRAGALAHPAGAEVLVASLPDGTDPADLLRREGVDAARKLVAGARAFSRFHVEHHLDRGDTSTAEGKDRLVRELHGVFADIPSSAVREELTDLVANQLELQPALVRSWLLEPGTPADHAAATDADPYQSSATTRRDPGCRRLLAQCVADPEVAAALPSGAALKELFPDALAQRAAEHIRGHSPDPTAGLPADDHELISFVTSLLSAPISASSDT